VRILFLTPYPYGTAPGQRFRYEQYLDLLTAHGHQYRLSAFLSISVWTVLYKPGHALTKVLGVLAGFGRRVFDLFRAPGYDFVFVFREATPLGPPVFEWVLAKVLRKRIIYDFDDAIWLQDPIARPGLLNGLKWTRKVSSICRWSYRVACGNAYLRAYAARFNPAATINPTTLDTDHLHNRVRDQYAPGPLVIGWTGTHTTLRHLDLLWPVLERLEAEGHAFEFCVIANRAPDRSSLRSLRFVPWNKQTEIDDLLSFHVGLMPLVDDAWARGKCAFKALQYMALGIPALVSPVGMNTEVVQDGVNGFVCNTPAEWYAALHRLLAQPSLRAGLGASARRTIVERYSVRSNTANFLHYFTHGSE